jgi:hypothetical protein
MPLHGGCLSKSRVAHSKSYAARLPVVGQASGLSITLPLSIALVVQGGSALKKRKKEAGGCI